MLSPPWFRVKQYPRRAEFKQPWPPIALAAGLAAGSIALIGFGADSLIEALAGRLLWLYTGNRRGSSAAERRAQQLISVSFFVLAGYVGIEALHTRQR